MKSYELDSKLIFGRCGCEYPCSCCEFEGQKFGSWKDVLAHVITQRDEYAEKAWKYDDLCK